MHVTYKILLSLILIPTGLFSQSEWIRMGTNNKLIYKTSDKGDKIMDFSHAGYMGGGVALPDVPVKKVVTRIPGVLDYSDLIQDAINEVSSMPLVNGLRGAVLLAPGKYPCGKSLIIAEDGVVLRGSGTSKESVIVMQGSKHTAIVLNNKSSENSQKIGNRLGIANLSEHSFKISDAYIPAGASSFTVENASGLSAGDNIEIHKPVTAKWIQFMQMDNLVRDGKPQTWIKAGSSIITERIIASINENRITLTVPLADSYNSRFTDDNTTVVVVNHIKRDRKSVV